MDTLIDIPTYKKSKPLRVYFYAASNLPYGVHTLKVNSRKMGMSFARSEVCTNFIIHCDIDDVLNITIDGQHIQDVCGEIILKQSIIELLENKVLVTVSE